MKNPSYQTYCQSYRVPKDPQSKVNNYRFVCQQITLSCFPFILKELCCGMVECRSTLLLPSMESYTQTDSNTVE